VVFHKNILKILKIFVDKTQNTLYYHVHELKNVNDRGYFKMMNLKKQINKQVKSKKLKN